MAAAAVGDFIGISQKSEEADCESATGLCCCEYIDKDQQRFHILGCCCNCEAFDQVFTRLIQCRQIEPHTRRLMLLTFQDRLRIPWRDGAKQVSLDTLASMLAVPVIIFIAAINKYAAFLMFIATGAFILYAYVLAQRTLSRTRFFSMWLFWSLAYMVALYEITVPLLELLPEENFMLVLLSSAALYCFWRTRKRAALNHVVQSLVAEDELPDITEATAAEEEEAAAQTTLLLEHDDDDDVNLNSVITLHGSKSMSSSSSGAPNICSSCRKYVPPRTAHCSVCGACIMRHDHHSFWLNCCVGEWNHRSYLAGLLFAELALLLGVNLTLTAVCHPYLVVRVLGVPVMLPDDCSEVFDDYQLSISYVLAIYAIIMATYVFVALVRQFYYISRGTTMFEGQRGYWANPKTFLSNWKAFIF